MAAGTAKLVGTGKLSASARWALAGVTIFAGNSSLSINLSQGYIAKPEILSGSSSLLVNLLLISSQALFFGTGSLSILGWVYKFDTSQFAGTGKMCTQATVRLGSPFGIVNNIMVNGSGATQNVVV